MAQSSRAPLTEQAARLYYSKVTRRKPLPPGVDGRIWESHVAQRPPRWRRRMMRDAAGSPARVLAMHVAAMAIQRYARGFVLRAGVGRAAPSSAAGRVPLACRRAAAAATAWRTGRKAAEKVVSTRGADSTELSLVARYLEAKVRRGPAANEVQFNDWILLRLQAYARMVPWRAYLRAMRSTVLAAAARSIQHGRMRQLRRRAGLEPAAPRDGPFSRGRAAFLIQRAWRGFTNKRIFGYLREMLFFREQGDAKELLRCINPREAKLIDAATAIHVRFRLGGSLFPPAIYYKVFTHGPVTDVGAFAPRDYTAHNQPPPIVLHNHHRPGDGRAELAAAALQHDGWYRRIENNGWRPVAGEALGDLDITARTSKPVVWHHDRLVRKEAALRKRKERKREWMRTMYALGKSGDADNGDAAAPAMPYQFDDEDDEDVDALLECAPPQQFP